MFCPVAGCADMPSVSSRARHPLREVVSVLAAVAVALVTRSSLADHYVVPTGSMLPTVQLDDHVVVSKLAYGVHLPLVPGYVARFDGPARGDVVVLKAPDTGIVLLKRIAAVPGDRVRVHDGALEVNGQPVPIVDDHGVPYEALGDKPHPLDLADGGGPDLGPLTLPRDRYLVLGDNRGNSRDGRFFGLVERDAILGHVEGVVIRGGRPTWIGL
jgi:signal peptidase I